MIGSIIHTVINQSHNLDFFLLLQLPESLPALFNLLTIQQC